jgi:hypothetical protein
MSAIKWFKVQVHEGPKQSFAYFYETNSGRFDLQYGWQEFSSGMQKTLEEAIEAYRSLLQAKHNKDNQGVQVGVGLPYAVQWSEVQKASPSLDIPVASSR